MRLFLLLMNLCCKAFKAAERGGGSHTGGRGHGHRDRGGDADHSGVSVLTVQSLIHFKLSSKSSPANNPPAFDLL